MYIPMVVDMYLQAKNSQTIFLIVMKFGHIIDKACEPVLWGWWRLLGRWDEATEIIPHR